MKPALIKTEYIDIGMMITSLVFTLILMSAAPARAFTTPDANTIFNAYNNAFYESTLAVYKDNTGGGRAQFWKFAEEIEMACDNYNRTRSSSTKSLISSLCGGFNNTYGSDWSWDPFNDDIMWATIAFLRAYGITGNAAFLTEAKTNFDMAYARGWDTSAGGFFWKSPDNNYKASAVNGPAAIAAFLLFAYDDTSYLTKSQNIFNWQQAVLFNGSTGKVWDGITNGGVNNNKVNFGATTYNQGTFIGAADYLGKSTYATLAANYTKNNMCTGGLLPHVSDAGSNGDDSGFNGIFMRWMAKFMNDYRLQGTYLSWLEQNADAAWSVRRTSDNLSWCNWDTQTPSGTLYSFACSDSVVALQVLPGLSSYWHGWDNPGGGNGFESGFAACSWGPNRLDVFGVEASDGYIHHNWWNGSAWNGWSETHVTAVLPVSSPCAAANNQVANREDVYYIGTDGFCYHQYWGGSAGWLPAGKDSWEKLSNFGLPSGVTLTGTPSAADWAGLYDVYALGSNNRIYHNEFVSGSGWLGWFDTGGSSNLGGISSCSWGGNRLDAFALGNDIGSLYHQFYYNGVWYPGPQSWQQDPPDITGAIGVGACSWGSGRIDVFLNTGSTIAHNWYDNGAWHNNWNETHTPPSVPISPPSAASWGFARIDVFVLGDLSDGRKCYHTWYGAP